MFLLVAEGLSRFILASKAEGSFTGISISQVMYITHLLFVDDILIFTNGSRQDVDKVAAGLSLLQTAAGMVVNTEKSTISCSNLSEQETHGIALRMPYRILDLNEGIKYLGFILKPNSYLKAD